MCPKVTIIIPEELDDEIRDYIRSKYRKPFGKLSDFFAISAQEKLAKEKMQAEKKGK